jgi:hypothetical protein
MAERLALNKYLCLRTECAEERVLTDLKIGHYSDWAPLSLLWLGGFWCWAWRG